MAKPIWMRGGRNGSERWGSPAQDAVDAYLRPLTDPGSPQMSSRLSSLRTIRGVKAFVAKVRKRRDFAPLRRRVDAIFLKKWGRKATDREFTQHLWFSQGVDTWKKSRGGRR